MIKRALLQGTLTSVLVFIFGLMYMLIPGFTIKFAIGLAIGGFITGFIMGIIEYKK